MRNREQTILFFVIAQMLLCFTAFAQKKDLPDSISILTLKDGSVYTGDVMLKRDSNFVFYIFQKGPMIIKNNEVISFRKVLRKSVDTIATPVNAFDHHAQHFRHNALFLDFGTIFLFGLSASINYSYSIQASKMLNISFRAGYSGFSYVPLHDFFDGKTYSGGGPLIGVSADWFGPSTHLETGICYLHAHSDSTGVSNIISAVVGFKYQDPHRIFYFRTTGMPSLFLKGARNENGNQVVVFVLDIGLGFTF